MYISSTFRWSGSMSLTSILWRSSFIVFGSFLPLKLCPPSRSSNAFSDTFGLGPANNCNCTQNTVLQYTHHKHQHTHASTHWVVQKKLHKVLHMKTFETFIIESHWMHQNAWLRLLSTHKYLVQNFYMWLNILLNSWKQLHISRRCSRTDWNTWLCSCRQMFLTSLSRQTDRLTHLMWTMWITQFGAASATGIQEKNHRHWPS